MTSLAARVEEAQMLASEAINQLVEIKQHLAVHMATGVAEPLSEALAIVMKLDDNVGGDLFRDIRLAERTVRRA